MITIALADDHNLVREGIAMLLKEEPGFQVVAQCSNGRELVSETSRLRPNVVVVDISMPELNGLEAARQIRKLCPHTRIIVLSVYSDESYIRDALELGISGYVIKADAGNNLIEAIRKGSRSNVYFSDEIEGLAAELQFRNSGRGQANFSKAFELSSREREVLQLIGEGFSSKEIAEKLNIAETTVKSHRNNLMDKLNVRDVAGLTRHAIRLRLVCVE